MPRIPLCFCLLALLQVTVHAQLPQIRITGIFPAGAQRGTSVDVAVTAGSDLDEAGELVFSHPGLTATQKTDANGQPVTNQFSVSVDPNIEPGLYDVRLRGLFGISNPRIFRIDTIAEVAETEPNNTDEQAQLVGVNTVVNARSNGAADVDVYTVEAKAGQTIVFRTEAAVLDSLMQPVVELFDAEGRRVAHARRRRQQDAALVFTSPVDQKLKLKIHDTVYAGSNDYVYRLAVDTRPLIDFTSPTVVQAGADTAVTLFGRNLPDGEATDQTLDGQPLMKKQVTVGLTAPEQRILGTDSAAASIDTAIWSGVDGNLLSFAVRQGAPATQMESIQTETPQTETPQVVSLPADVFGSFATELDEDVYRFEASKGDRWQIDILAHRVGSAADPLLIVEQITRAADGTESAKRLAREDENKQNPGGNNLPTLTSDPSFLLTAPEDGLYQIRLKDRFGASRGAANLTYTVSIQKPAPDFRIVVFDSLPSADGKAPPGTGAISIRKGGTYEVTVYAYRSGGHNADIQLKAEGLPAGVQCSDAVIRAGQSSALLVFSAAADAGETVTPVRIIGTSAGAEQQLEHTARIATLVHGGANGLPRTGRVSGSLLVSVMKDDEPVSLQSAVASADVSQDQQLLIPLKVTRRSGFEDKVTVAFAGQPGNVDVPAVTFEKGQDSVMARLYFKENAAAGPATLLMYATAQVPYRRNPWQVDRAKARVEAAVKQLESTNAALVAAKEAAAAGTKKVAELAAMLKTMEEQLVAEQKATAVVEEELKAAVATKAKAASQLSALQKVLTDAAAAAGPEAKDLDAAIKAVETATVAVTDAARPVVELTKRLNELTTRLTEKQKLVKTKAAQVAEAKAAMVTQQQAIEKATAEVKAAEAALKAEEAAKKAAEEAVKKAEEASKPQNKNVRSIAVPVSLTVHPTPGKITAAVPGGGAIKKGATVDVKVTVARKNKFAGPVTVALVLPEGVTQVTSDSIDIPADQTEGVLRLTAAADAAPGDIAHAVIRATAADFNGRPAHFDTPITLKVTE
ncbi:MAG: hypothetical protein RIK87_11585 [Fuerstiella sp.]